MTEVRPVRGFSPGRGPWCCFEIEQWRLSKRNLADRERMAEAKGIDPGQCGHPAEVVVDGESFCRRHAGETLLREFIGPGAGRFGRD